MSCPIFVLKHPKNDVFMRFSFKKSLNIDYFSINFKSYHYSAK